MTAMIILPTDTLIKTLLPVDGEATLVKRESQDYGFSVGMLLNGVLIMPPDHCLCERQKNGHFLSGYGHVYSIYEVRNNLVQSVWFWLKERDGQTALCWDIKTTHYDSTRRAIAQNFTSCLTGCPLAPCIEKGVLDLSANIEDERGLDLFKVYFATR